VTEPRISVSYAAAFARYLREPGEDALRAAYELGRAAVTREMSVLELAVIHHDALLEALRERTGEAELEQVARAGAEFFVEGLSAFEMLQRVLRQAHETALVERRQAAMVRQLSTFLTDTSLAAASSESLAELLQLSAEQARELTNAGCCRIIVSDRAHTNLEAIAYSDEDDEREATVAAASVLALVRAAEPPGRPPARDRRDESQLRAVPSPPPAAPGSRLVVPLTALDGRLLGALELIDTETDAFGDADEAVALHLAQMISAAIERVRVYDRHERPPVT
jgi:transcriptional regulator with GAF, ATPase, and Fis domain